MRSASRRSGPAARLHDWADSRRPAGSARLRLGGSALRIREDGVIRELLQTTGEVSRKRYLATGLSLFAVKYALDYVLTAVVFHRHWRWFPYLDPLGEI